MRWALPWCWCTVWTAAILCAEPTLSAQSITLRFEWAVKTPDCVGRSTVVVNGQFPPAPIRVAAGELVAVRVQNRLGSAALSVHWHGIEQRGTPWSDGAPQITQCPTPPGTDQIYRWYPPTSPGTFVFRGLLGVAGAGVSGLILVEPADGIWPSTMAHDQEYALILSDWFHDDSLLRGAVSPPGDPQTLLLNGRGFFNCSENHLYRCPAGFCQNPGGVAVCPANLPPYNQPVETRFGCAAADCPGREVFRVRFGLTYLFRVANAATRSLLNVKVGGHNLTVVSLDGNAVQPVVREDFDIGPGQRVDFLLTADRPASSYWLSVAQRELATAEHLHVEAILEYEGSSSPPAASDLPNLVSRGGGAGWHVDRGGMLEDGRAYEALSPEGVPAESAVVRRIVVLSTVESWGTRDKASAQNASVAGLVGTGADRPERFCSGEGGFAPGTNRRRAELGITPALHRLFYGVDATEFTADSLHFELQVGGVYDVVLQNYPTCSGSCDALPFHLHGNHFWVIGTWEGEFDGTVPESGGRPHVRDTVVVPGEGRKWPGAGLYSNASEAERERRGCGFAIIRFRADNPGVWALQTLDAGDQSVRIILYTPRETVPPPSSSLLTVCGDLRPADVAGFSDVRQGGCEPSTLPMAAGDAPQRLFSCSVDVGLSEASLHWTVDTVLSTVTFGVRSRSTGWLALEFPETQGRMTPGIAVQGWAPNRVGVFAVEPSLPYLRSVPEAGPAIGLVNSSESFEQQGGYSILRFTRALCGSQGDCIDPSQPTALNVAYHATSSDPTEGHLQGTNSAAGLLVTLDSGVSADVTDTTTLDWKRTHAALMLAAWLFVAPLAAMTKRYGKPVFSLSVSSLNGPRSMHTWHILVAVTGLVLTACGFVYAGKLGWYPGRMANLHGIMGTLMFFAIACQPTIGALGIAMCPRFDDTYRRLFNVVHGYLGWLLVLAGVAQSFTGMEELKEYYVGWRDYQVAAVTGVVLWGVLIFVCELLLRGFYIRRKPKSGQPAKRSIHRVVTDLEHVRTHNTIDDCWVVVDGMAYEVTDWLPSHPGGPSVIMPFAGGEATEAFKNQRHSQVAHDRLTAYYRADVESDRVVNSVKLAENVTNCLVSMNLDEAQALIGKSQQDKDLPLALCTALVRLVCNLRIYRGFLPESLLTFETSEMCSRIAAMKPPTGTVAIVFTDICGSTGLWERCPEGMEAAMDLHNSVLRRNILEFEGYEVKTIGDAFMVSFGDAGCACKFGARVQEMLDEQPWPDVMELAGLPNWDSLEDAAGVIFSRGIRIRIGVHYGAADSEINELTGRVDYRGPVVNLAARMEGAAVPGMVLVSSDVKSGAGDIDGIEYVAYGAIPLKGVKDPVTCFAVASDAIIKRQGFWAVEMKSKRAGGNATTTTSIRRHSGSLRSNPLSAVRQPSSSPAGSPTRSEKSHSTWDTRGRLPSLDVPHDDLDRVADLRLQGRTQMQLHQVTGTVGLIDMLPAEDHELQAATILQTTEEIIGTILETIGRTGGKFEGIRGSQVQVTWNVLAPCLAHTMQVAAFCGLLRQPGRPVFSLGLGSGPVTHGNVGYGRSRHTLLGPAAGLARRAASLAMEVGARALIVYLPQTPDSLKVMLRPVDSWLYYGRLVIVEELLTTAAGVRLWDRAYLDECSLEVEDELAARDKYRQTFIRAVSGDAAAMESITDDLPPTDRVLHNSVPRIQQACLTAQAEGDRGHSKRVEPKRASRVFVDVQQSPARTTVLESGEHGERLHLSTVVAQ